MSRRAWLAVTTSFKNADRGYRDRSGLTIFGLPESFGLVTGLIQKRGRPNKVLGHLTPAAYAKQLAEKSATVTTGL